MGLSIGPIELTFLEAHNWDVRRQIEMVNVPFARQTGYTVGAELVTYQLTGAFHADTDTEAKQIRRQLNELFNNPDIDFEYIEFDLDDEELSGWFLLDSINTQIIPGVFGDYPFSCSVRRLGNIENLKIGGYWKSNELTNDYGLSAREWLAIPNGLGSGVGAVRTGEGGSNQMVTSPTANPIVYQGDFDTSTYYDMRCRLVDYTTILPSSSTWTDIYGKDHKFATAGASYMMHNGLIGLDHSQVAGPTKILKGLLYNNGSASWQIYLTRFYLKNAAGTTYTILHRPVIEKYNYDEIVWTVMYGDTSDNNNFPVTFRLRRGTYFIDVEIPVRETGVDIGPNTSIEISGDPFTSSSSAANYFVGVNTSTQMGFLYTETASPSYTSTAVKLGQTISASNVGKFAILLTSNPLPSGVTLANLGTEYIANISQQTVLVNPKWL